MSPGSLAETSMMGFRPEPQPISPLEVPDFQRVLLFMTTYQLTLTLFKILLNNFEKGKSHSLPQYHLIIHLIFNRLGIYRDLHKFCLMLFIRKAAENLQSKLF